jgi:hypothetical protein
MPYLDLQAGQAPAMYLLVPASTIGSAGSVLSAAPANAGAALRMPLAGQYAVTQQYGPTSFAAEPAYDGYSHFHTGLDYGCPEDTPIAAARSGTVIAAGWDTSGFGNRVMIDHGGGLVTLYGHLDNVTVKVGDKVQAGQQIGLSGTTGNSTGPHLHFGVEKNGAWVDPAPYLNGTIPGSASMLPAASLPDGRFAVSGSEPGPEGRGLVNVPALGGAMYLVPVMPIEAGSAGGQMPGLQVLPTSAGSAVGIGGATSLTTAYPAGAFAPLGVTCQSLTPQALQDLVQQASSVTGVPGSLINAVVQTESGGDPNAVSPAGAKGLMQLMDSTAAKYGVTNSFDPRQNLIAGSTFLAGLLHQFNGSVPLAVAAYNAGPSAVQNYGGVPPYSETQGYVQRVLQLQQQYEAQP